MGPGDKSKVFFSAIVIMASKVIEMMIFFIINIIIARYLDLDRYGEYTTALAFASFFSLFTDMGINDGLIREMNYEKELYQTLFNTGLLKLFLSVIVFLAFIVVTCNTGYSHEVVILILIFGLVRFGDEYLRLYYTYFEGKGEYFKAAIYRMFFSICFFISVCAVVLINGGSADFAWFRLIVVSVFIIILTYSVSRGKLIRIDIAYIIAFARKTFPFSLTFIYGNIITQAGLIILPLMHGTVYSGIYQNAYIFITSLLFIPVSFGRVFIPYLYKQREDEDVEKFQFAFEVITKSFVFISVYISVIFFLYSGFIITGVFGDKYHDSIGTLRILSLAIPFLFSAANIILTALDRQKLYNVVLGYMAVVSIFLNISLGYLFRDKGIAVASVITFFVIFILTNIQVRFNSVLSVKNPVISYLKGGFIFIICFFADRYLGPGHALLNIILVSALFFSLGIILLFTKDDLRIAKEVFGRTG